MSNIMRKSFSEGEIKTPDKVLSSTVTLGNVSMSQVTLQPGWSWSSCIKPLVGTESCEAGHVGVVIKGEMKVKHDDGSEETFKAGDAYYLAPGHDGWIVGDKEFQSYEFTSDQKDFGPWKK